MDNKRIVMICQFSQIELRNNLTLSDLRLVNTLRHIFGASSLSYKDNAPWIDAILSNFTDVTDIELHVISPHIGMKRKVESFSLNNINFHYFKSHPSVSIAGLVRKLFPNHPIDYSYNRGIINGLIQDIDPSLIVLVGVEGPIFSTSVLDVKNVPIFVIAQTIIQDPGFKSHFSKGYYKYLTSLERKIFNRSNNVGVYSDNHFRLLKESGYNGNIFRFSWPEKNESLAEPMLGINKCYDFINFATRMSDEKGYPDSILALAIVKRYYPNVKLNLIDTGATAEKHELVALIKKLDLTQNVSFTPFFEKSSDLYIHIQKSRFGVLPCKLDYISGTTLQCMQYGIPLVVYKTSGTPTLNADVNSVLIAEINDIEGLAKNMLKLLNNEDLGKELRQNALMYIRKRHQTNLSSFSRLLDYFKAVINHNYNNVPIPSDFLNDEISSI